MGGANPPLYPFGPPRELCPGRSLAKVSDEYFLAPMQVHVVSQGDDLLWDGASKFVNSDTLRFRVGDSVKCLVADIWVGGAPHVPLHTGTTQRHTHRPPLTTALPPHVGRNLHLRPTPISAPLE